MKKGLLLLGVLLLSSTCFAQGADPGAAVPRRVILALARDRSTQLSDGETMMMSRSILSRLQAASSEFIMVERPPSVVAASASDLSAEAGKEGADGWVSVVLSGGWSSMRISVRAFDLLTNRQVVDQSFTRTAYALAELPLETWSDIVRSVVPQFRSALSAARPAGGPAVAHLTIKARAGTRVTGDGVPPLQVGADGTASLSLPASREYLLWAQLSGYYTSSTRIFLSADRQVVLPQDPSPGWAVEASLQDFGYPRIDLTWFPASQNAYFKLGLMTYLVGLAFDSTRAISSAPLTNVEAQMGFYLNPAGSLFRISLGLGCFFRVVTVPGSYFGLDPLSPWGMRGVIGVELSPMPRSRFFLELTPTVYMTPAPDVFRSLLGTDNAPPGWISGDSSFADIFSLRIGYRWML